MTDLRKVGVREDSSRAERRLPWPLRDAVILHAPGLTGGGDIDVIVGAMDPWWPLRLVRDRLCQCLWYDVTGWYWVLERGGETIPVDTLVDPGGRGKYAFVAADVRSHGGVADPATRAAYLALKRLRKGDRGPDAWASIAALAASDRGAFKELLIASLGPTGRELAEAVLVGRPPSDREWRRLRRAQRLRRIRGPLGLPSLAVRTGARWVERIVKPTGLTVLLAGPDGAGKSSVAGALTDACRGLFRRQRLIHWRPGLLPAPSRLAGTAPVDPTRPHQAPPHGRALSLARLGYFFMDFLLSGILVEGPHRVRTGLTLIERGWWDMLVDPRRYRLAAPQGLVRTLGRLLPRPDLVFVLDAPREVLRARKQELPPEELERQRRAWLALGVPGTRKIVLDATRPLHQVVGAAREVIVEHLERRAVARLGAGWVNLPSRRATRWWLPRGPRAAAFTGLAVYQPVTSKGRAGWEAARLLARGGGFRLLPRADAPPRDVRVRLAEHLPPRTTYAVMRANHPGRYVALLVDDHGRATGVAKVATTPESEEALRREARAIRECGDRLPPPVRAPRILGEGPGVLLLEPVPFRPRRRPWQLLAPVARALGALEAQGLSHGDAAPWNLLEDPGGAFVLVDWEAAGPAPSPGWDLWHWLVQACALLGRPGARELLAALDGEGDLGPSVQAFLRAAGLEREDRRQLLRRYLERSVRALDPGAEDGRRGLETRQALLRQLGPLRAGRT